MLVDNLRGLLGIARKDRLPNARVKELYGVVKGVDERVLLWFSHIERMKNDRIDKCVYVGGCVGNSLVG